MSRYEDKTKIRAVCAMSGGVDSAVSAALLVRGGFEVTGLFMKLTDGGKESEQRARENALRQGIPFQVLDLRDEFKKIVIDKFISDTKKGLTPNPCVDCNREIKFGLLIEKALAMGADFIATGHYCQVKKTKDGIYHLLKGADKNKDQSYFLWHLNQKQLSRVIFPAGCFEKNEVRKLAKKWKLPGAAAPESQEVCFVNGDIDNFLEKHCGRKPGKIVDAGGNVLGEHNGLWFYTIGQRKGIKLSGGPFYVVKKDFRGRQLVVSKKLKESNGDMAEINNLKWVSLKVPLLPLKVRVKIRYRSKEAAAVIDKVDGKYQLKFLRPQFAVTPGQSAVFYRGRELLGGGIIKA